MVLQGQGVGGKELSRCLQGWELAKKRQAWDPAVEGRPGN